MRRDWIYMLGLLAIVATNCLVFTVEASTPRNWSTPIFNPERRAAIEKIVNGEVRSSDIQNILHDSGTKDADHSSDAKYFSPLEDRRAKLSENVTDRRNRTTVLEKIPPEFKESRLAEKIISESKKSTKAEKMLTEAKESKITVKMITEPKESKDDEKIITDTKESKITGKMITEPKESKDDEKIITDTKESKITGKMVTEPKESKEKVISETKVSKTATPSSIDTNDSKITSDKNVDSGSPKNVVLVLVDDVGTGRKNHPMNFKDADKFPVHAFLQNCHSDKVSAGTMFIMGKPSISGNKNEECDCDRYLRANVGELLSWARQTKEMTTSVISATNFTIPSALGSESPSGQLVKEFEDNDEMNGLRQEVPRFNSDPKDSWRFIDLDKQSSQFDSAPANLRSSPKQDRSNGYDGVWDVFDIFSRIRMAFFRILLENLGNMTGSEDDVVGRKIVSVQPSVVELVTDAFRELKTVSSDKGFIFIAVVPKGELFPAVEVLQSEISIKNTLLVITGTCSSANDQLVPLFAHGPGEQSLLGARAIWDLPGSIRNSMRNECQDDNCKNERREEPLVLASLGLLPLPEDLPRKRVVRAKAEEETTDTTTDDKPRKESENDEKDNKITAEAGKRSGARNIRVDNVAGIFGILISIVAMLALNSS